MASVSVRIAAETRALAEGIARAQRELDKLARSMGQIAQKQREIGQSKDMDRLTQNLERFLKAQPGFGGRLDALGMDRSKPWNWDFNRMYLDAQRAQQQQAHVLRQLYGGTRWELPARGAGGGSGGGAPGWGGGWGPGLGGFVHGGPGAAMAGMSISAITSIVRTVNRIIGQTYDIPTTLGGMMSYGIGGAKQQYGSADTLFRSAREAGMTFDRVLQDLDKYAGQLRLTSSDIGKLMVGYARESRESSEAQRLEGTRIGAGLARGWGIEPEEGVQYMAQARRVGLYGGDQAGAQRFGLVIGKTIADGMMTGRPGDAFESMIKLAENVNSRRVEGLTQQEIEAAASMRSAGSMLAQNGMPGLTGGSYDQILARMTGAIVAPPGGFAGQLFGLESLKKAGAPGGIFGLLTAQQEASPFSSWNGGPMLMDVRRQLAHQRWGFLGQEGEDYLLAHESGVTVSQLKAMERARAEAGRYGLNSGDTSAYLGGIDLSKTSYAGMPGIFKSIQLAKSGDAAGLRQYAEQYYGNLAGYEQKSGAGAALREALDQNKPMQETAKALIQLQAETGRERTVYDEMLDTEKAMKQALIDIAKDLLPPAVKALQEIVPVLQHADGIIEGIGEVFGIKKTAPSGSGTLLGPVGRFQAGMGELGLSREERQSLATSQRQIDAYQKQFDEADATVKELEAAEAGGANLSLWEKGKLSAARASRDSARGKIDEAKAKIGRIQGKANPRADVATKLARMRDYYQKELGLTDFQAAAMAGNAYHESSLNPSALGDHGTAHGLFQWRGKRWEGLKEYAAQTGRSPYDEDVQIEYAAVEMKNGERAAYDKLKGTRSIEEASRSINQNYERSADVVGGGADLNRIRWSKAAAEAAYKAATGKDPNDSSATPMDAPGMPAPPSPDASTGKVSGEVAVTVTVQDPKGNVKDKKEHKMGLSTGKPSGNSGSVEHRYDHDDNAPASTGTGWI